MVFAQINQTKAPSSSATNQTKSSSPSLSGVATNQTAAKQQQPVNNTVISSAGKNATSAVQDQNTASSNPLANIPIIGKLFGGK